MLVRIITTLCLFSALKAFSADVDQLKQKAEGGDVSSQSRIAELYLRGDGVTKDNKEAAKWFSRAASQYKSKAENGDAQAQVRYALMLQGIARANFKAGETTEFSEESREAVFWLLKAAYQGNSQACAQLSTSYFLG